MNENLNLRLFLRLCSKSLLKMHFELFKTVETEKYELFHTKRHYGSKTMIRSFDFSSKYNFKVTFLTLTDKFLPISKKMLTKIRSWFSYQRQSLPWKLESEPFTRPKPC
jgi:hypothetical protein